MTVRFQLPVITVGDKQGEQRYLEVDDDSAEFWDNAGLVREGETRSRSRSANDDLTEDPIGDQPFPQDVAYERSNVTDADLGQVDEAANEEPAPSPAKKTAKSAVTRDSAKGDS
jgi:hypothetical protein